MRLPLFHGRLRRRSFWLAGFGLCAAFFALFVPCEANLGRPSTLVLYAPFYWILFALLTRRLHDRGRSPLLLLVLLVPLLGPLWLAIELLFIRGTRGVNRYGPDPVAPAGSLTVA